MEPESDIEDVLRVWDCDDNPLFYMIEPRGWVRAVDKDHVTKPKDLESILDKYLDVQ